LSFFQLEASIQMSQQKMREFKKQLVIVREKHKKQPMFNLDQLKPDMLWNHLIKVELLWQK
jgi:hypothetical protein